VCLFAALLHPKAIRSATIRCVTPVHAIEISREYFKKYLSDGYDVQLSLREKDNMRKLQRAKTILRLQQNLEERIVSKGDYIYKVGETGTELFILEEGKLDVIVEDHTVFNVHPGGLCGEHSLIFGRHRNTSAKCVSNECKLQVLRAADFFRLMDSHPSVRESLKGIGLRREFQKALVFKTKKAFPSKEQDLWKAFDAADENRSGKLDLEDIRGMLIRMDKTFTDQEIKEILESLDLDRSGAVSFEEFKRMFGMSNEKWQKAST
jgi:CRP-like cAMP-binding protein